MIGEFALLMKLLEYTFVGLTGMGAASILFNNNTSEKEGTAKLENHRILKEYKGNNGFIISRNVRFDIKTSIENTTLILGPINSRKSRGFIGPTIDNSDDYSMIVCDPKSELYEAYSDSLKERGYTVSRINFEEPDCLDGVSLDFLDFIKNDEDAIKVAQCIIFNAKLSLSIGTNNSTSDIQWDNFAVALLTAIILYCKAHGGIENNFNDVTNMLQYPFEVMDKLLRTSKNKDVKRFYNKFAASIPAQETVSGILTTLQNNLTIFSLSSVRNFFNCPNRLKLDDFKTKKVALFIQLTEEKTRMYYPISSVIYELLLSHNIRLSNQKKYPVICIMDEFPSIGVIPDLDSKLVTMRSRSVGVYAAAQSYEKIEANYGSSTESIIAAFKCLVALPGLPPKTTKYLSDLCGITQIKKISRNNGEKTSTTLSTEARNLFNSDEIRRIEKGYELIVCENKNPVIDKIYVRDYEKESFFFAESKIFG